MGMTRQSTEGSFTITNLLYNDSFLKELLNLVSVQTLGIIRKIMNYSG